jgi:DNA-binding MarR family transcriptional regulator
MHDKKDPRAVVREWVQSFTVRSLHGMAHYARTRGLSLPQYSILMRLHHAGCEVHDIGRIFAVSPAAASQLVEKLVQAGLVARTESPEDRRVRRIALTTKGRALIARGLEERFRWVDDLVAALAPEERAALVTSLRPLLEAEKALPGREDPRGARHAIRSPRARPQE